MADNRYGERGHGRGDSIFSDDERGRPAGGGDRDRGFLQRAGEEVKSWFGGGEDDRRAQSGTREIWGGGSDWSGGSPYDYQYTSWRDRQISLLDREYEDYCRHRQQQFENDFHSWRESRQGQGGSGALPSGGATAQGGSRLTPDASSGTSGRSRGRATKANP
jgi:hypothetical protein